MRDSCRLFRAADHLPDDDRTSHRLEPQDEGGSTVVRYLHRRRLIKQARRDMLMYIDFIEATP